MIQVHSENGQVTLQNKTHVLEGEIRDTFVTDRLDMFKSYVEGYSDVEIFYGDEKVTAWSTVRGDDYDVIPYAECSLEDTDIFKKLCYLLSSDFRSGKELEPFIRAFAPYGPGFLQVAHAMRNYRMKKIVSVDESRDTRGNSAYSCQIADAGNETIDLPDEVEFLIPIYKHIAVKIKIKATIEIDFKKKQTDTGGTLYEVVYRFVCHGFDEIVADARKEIIDSELKAFTCPKYWGDLKVVKTTDEWRYKDVPMRFEGMPSQMTYNW